MFWEAVEQYDQDELLEMHDQCKDQGEAYWHKWIAFVERRAVVASQKIQKVRHL